MQDSPREAVTAEILHDTANKLGLRLALPDPSGEQPKRLFAPCTPELQPLPSRAEPNLVDISQDLEDLEVSPSILCLGFQAYSETHITTFPPQGPPAGEGGGGGGRTAGSKMICS